jgi:hypothetical protein
MSMIYGCYCDGGCIKYGDCCKIYSTECEKYFNQVEVDEFELPVEKKENLVGTCCNKSQPPVNCYCDIMCKRTGDCCKDFGKCIVNKKIIMSNKTMHDYKKINKTHHHKKHDSHKHQNNTKNLKSQSKNKKSPQHKIR